MNSEEVLVTGGTGFVGSHLVELLLSRGITPHVTSSSSEKGYVHTLLPEDHIHVVDLTHAESISQLFTAIQPSQIYHLAALAAVGSSYQQIEHIFENNVKLQLGLLETIKKQLPQSKVLVVGSGLEYDPYFLVGTQNQLLTETSPLGPISPYAVSKVFQDLLALSYHYSYGLNIVRVRPFNHIGERQSPEFAIPAFAKQIVAIERGQQGELLVGDLQATRDITDVKDVVRAYLLLMEKGQVGQVYNVGSGQGRTMQEFLDRLCDLSTATIKVSVETSRLRPNDPQFLVADISKITQLGWHAEIELNNTLQRVLQYWRNQQ